MPTLPLLAAAPMDSENPALLVAVGFVVLAVVVGAWVMLRRGKDDDQAVDYGDEGYDPVAAAAKARAAAEARSAEVEAREGDEEQAVVEAGDTVTPEPSDEPVAASASIPEASETEAERAARIAAEKEAFEAKKVADAEARAARRVEREREEAQASERRRQELEQDRARFEAERAAAYRIGLTKTRSSLLGKLTGVLSGAAAVDDELFDELEAVLFTSDIGARTADRLLEDLKERRKSERLKRPDQVTAALRAMIADVVDIEAKPLLEGLGGEETRVVMVVGVNGVGKTTSIGKIAKAAVSAGHSVLLGAGDTFRAAAVDQLEVWADRAGVPIVTGADNSDPSAVLFDTVKRGVDEGTDIVICDTAGRLHTRAELMDELKKMHRVMGKAMPGAPHEVLLVLDATIGQNAIAQARHFMDAIPVTGVVLTKLDGTARGGVIAGICAEFGVPVRYIGVGEGIEDLRPFEPKQFVDALFGDAS